MLLKDFPDYFASYKIYETVRNTMKRYAREKDIDQMLNELMTKEADPSNFLRKLSVVCKRHINITKASKMMMEIRENLCNLMVYKVDPANLTITKTGADYIKVYVSNKTDATFKFKVGIQQLNRDFTAIIFNTLKNFTTTKLVKSAIIEPGKMFTFKFTIKPDIYGIDDLYELKNNNQIKFMLGMQIGVEGIDSMKTNIIKYPVKVIKHRL